MRVLSVTDHDTVAAVPEVAALTASRGMGFVTGIEITAVWEDRDVHVLGYFLDHRSLRLQSFLRGQREDRIRRLRTIGARLADLGMPLDLDGLLESVQLNDGHSAGRPLVARALAAAGYVIDTSEAFERWIGDGKPAWVPRRGASPSDVFDLIAAAGGVASLAHPGLLRRDDLIPGLVTQGLAALEAYHAEHNAAAVQRYRALAISHALVVTGGSDFHGDRGHRRASLGAVSLPAAEFERLQSLASSR